MSQINSLKAYEDCRVLFDRALADIKGARAFIGEHSACINLRTRMHYFRKLDREANEVVYPAGHEMHGTSMYDPLVVQIIPDVDGKYWLYVQHRSADLYIEGLSELDAPLIDANPMDTVAHEVHMIEDNTNG